MDSCRTKDHAVLNNLLKQRIMHHPMVVAWHFIHYEIKAWQAHS